MKNILVYCGSSGGINEIYKQNATELGKVFAEKGVRLIYGGGSVGLMGTIADAVLANAGEVVGVIPSFMEPWEVQHKGLTEIHVVESMHIRKAIMAEMSDAVIAMPGGWGTLDELFEILTWRQLGLHEMPIGILNVNGFFDDLLKMIQKMVTEGFLKEINLNMFVVDASPEGLMEKLENYIPQGEVVGKWVERG
jgi:uncharacterized protein (TIGR00730 family)